jgi:YVTN family beta-propeller protein
MQCRNLRRGRILAVLVLCYCAGPGLTARADEQDHLTVGVQPDGRIVVPTNQILKPAGRQVTFAGRPVDLAFSEGHTLVIKNSKGLLFIDTHNERMMQRLETPKGSSVIGLAVGTPLLHVTGHPDVIFVSDAENRVHLAEHRWGRPYHLGASFELARPKVGGKAHPAGLLQESRQVLWVASTRGNSVQRIDLQRPRVSEVVPVGVAPFMIVQPQPDRLYVSNWGGDPPRKGDAQSLSSDTPVRIDTRTQVANSGTVSVLAPVCGHWRQIKTIPVGLHPSGMTLSPHGTFCYVANANSDSVSVIDTRKDAVVETIACRPEAALPFGSGTNALALSPDGRTLYAANGTNNCVAVIRLGARATEGGSGQAASAVLGLIPTGWYPGAVVVSPDGKKLYVANIKGHGSLSQPRPVAQGMNSHDALGSISIIDVPDAAQLARYTREVHENNRLAYSLAGLEKPRPGVRPVPIPVRHGEPSVIKHVIYVIKENRTYDQVFGDLKEGNGDPHLVMFGEDVTPNHHKLAREFTLFDNFYCSGVLSADGHSWCNEAYVTDYLERSFGGFTRSYPDAGQDALAYAPTGFLWDNALAHKKTLRNLGEFVDTSYTAKATWADFYRDFRDGKRRVEATARANLKSLEPYTHPGYPWFPLLMPDVYRARLFEEELRAYEKAGSMPNLVYVTLPCDHTDGTNEGFPTPRAMVADNDLALGRLVEAVSRSRFWKETCIFVVEDDPQDGFDHVDAHRTVALAISPYTRRHFVDHTNYNQTGMVKTIELILGLPPMNQLDLSATPMRYCFTDRPHLSPYKALPNRIRLDEMNPPLKKLTGKARAWAEKSMRLNFSDGDAADEDTLNRILWHATRGYDTPYPERFAGSGLRE